jgi:hypothetical protein
LVKSSEASNIVGFINGGSFESLPSAMAASVVSIDRVCIKPSAPTLLQQKLLWWAYLSIGQLENKRDLVSVKVLLLDLGSNPAFGDIGLPGLGADIIRGCHVGSSSDGRGKSERLLGSVSKRWIVVSASKIKSAALVEGNERTAATPKDTLSSNKLGV